MCIIPIMVGFSRIYYQCHYLGDVVVGGLVGFALAYVGGIYYPAYASLFRI